MSRQSGRNLALSPCRQLVVDLVHFSHQVPGATVERPLSLGRLVAARQACVPRPSWCAIIVKAMGIVAARRPELRRTYMHYPWPHLYEHPINVANFTIERRWHDEDVVFLVQVRRPEHKSLARLDQLLRSCQHDPVESVKFFRRAIRLSRVPWPLRRILWWASLNLFGKLRCHNYGTFSVSSVGAAGAGLVSLSPMVTSTLHYGLFDDKGNLPMRMTIDHRAIDGANAARALVELEQVLLTDILHELADWRPESRAAA